MNSFDFVFRCCHDNWLEAKGLLVLTVQAVQCASITNAVMDGILTRLACLLTHSWLFCEFSSFLHSFYFSYEYNKTSNPSNYQSHQKPPRTDHLIKNITAQTLLELTVSFGTTGRQKSWRRQYGNGFIWGRTHFFFHHVQEQLVQVHFYYELIMELVEQWSTDKSKAMLSVAATLIEL